MARDMIFKDRVEAGRLLGNALAFLKGRKDVVVLAIPRGGVPVAKEVADAIGAPMDLVITRKIGAPGNPELAVGAVTQEGEIITDEFAATLGVTSGYLKEQAAREAEEIRSRMRKYRGDRPYPELEGKTVVIVDDGIATGSTVRAAVKSVRKRGAAEVIIAAPVAPPDTVKELSQVADRVVCLSTPSSFYAIGEFYEEFEQVEDETVRRLMSETASR